MKFRNAFTVDAPVEEVWAALLDVERVAPCMPGAEVLTRVADDAYKIDIKIRVGPILMRYRGPIEIVECDEAARRATMRATTSEVRGQGTAAATFQMRLAERGRGTEATITTRVRFSGKAATMGQDVILGVADSLIERFAGNLAEMLADAREEDLVPAVVDIADRRMAEPEPEPGPTAMVASPATAAAAAPERPQPAPGGPPAAVPAPTPAPAPALDSLPAGGSPTTLIGARQRNARGLIFAVATVAIAMAVLGAIGHARRRAK